MPGIIVAIAIAIVMGFVYGSAYVMTCIELVSNGVPFDEVAELKNFRVTASVVIFVETMAISLWLSMK